VLRDRVRAGATMTWLDGVLEGLLADDGGLRAEFSLDGTHLHPRYVRLIPTAVL
jgi:hypothetical protein